MDSDKLMSRDVFGNRKVNKEDMYTKRRISSGDIKAEYIKMVMWIVSGYLFFHFVIMGWGI